MSNPQYSQGQLDAMAKERGFPNHAAWMAWTKKYRTPVQGKGQPESQNWFQALVNKIPIHPSYIFNYINDAFSGATGRKDQ